MIARIWHGRTKESDADAYNEYQHKTGVTNYRKVDGYRGVCVLKSVDGGIADFLLISFWDSLDAVKGFAGEQFDRAVYYHEDEKYLLEFESHVRHYEVLTREMK